VKHIRTLPNSRHSGLTQVVQPFKDDGPAPTTRKDRPLLNQNRDTLGGPHSSPLGIRSRLPLHNDLGSLKPKYIELKFEVTVA
jgi:hypothetical protein